MTECEDCKGESLRRWRCWHCGLMVCGFCRHHRHGCLPDHKPEECRDNPANKAKVEQTAG